jgi:DNA-binding CsgD family transcriptional regulator
MPLVRQRPAAAVPSIPSNRRGAVRPMLDLQSALDLESFWRANLQLLQSVLPHHSCSLMLGIVDFEPQEGRHFVAHGQDSGNQPLTSLSIARPFLAAHPHVKMYTYTEILQEDPRARQRRVERERHFRGWDEFVHLAFWDGAHPEAVLSIRRSVEQGEFLPEEREFLASLHPVIDAGLRRLRAFEGERGRRLCMERFIAGLPLPVMFLGPDRALQFATQEAFDLCAAWNFGYEEARLMNTRRCFRLPEPIAEGCARLTDIWDSAVHGDAAVGLESARVEHREISGLGAKVDVSQPFKGSLVRPGFWVTFSSERNLDGASPQLKAGAVHHLQFLTPSERRVALLVAEGLRNHDVARQLGKSPRTVDFQLNAIYRKLGVASRTELARLLY